MVSAARLMHPEDGDSWVGGGTFHVWCPFLMIPKMNDLHHWTHLISTNLCDWKQIHGYTQNTLGSERYILTAHWWVWYTAECVILFLIIQALLTYWIQEWITKVSRKAWQNHFSGRNACEMDWHAIRRYPSLLSCAFWDRHCWWAPQ